MPRPSLFDNVKFHRLAHILGIPRPHALGYLEYLWRVGYACGNPVIGDEVSVELACEWTGERGKLAAALLEAGFLDRRKNGKLQIHDLHDNAPDYVKSRFRMERYRKTARSKRLRNSYHSPAPTPTPIDIAAAPRKRKPDELFDAVCEVAGADATVNGSQIGKVCKSLRSAKPPYSADDVRRLPAAIQARNLDFTLTLGAIAKYIGWTREKPHANGSAKAADPAAHNAAERQRVGIE
jgi:hypothetical protein